MLKRMPRVLQVVVLIAMVGLHWVLLHAEPANIIFFIGDGMGFEQVKAANFYAGEPLSFENFPHQAQCTTYSADSGVTDSAAAATAMATAIKVNNGVISMAYPGDGSELETLLEYFERVYGKSTGLVTTTYLTHATPAGFGAHEPSRNNLSQIAYDYLNQSLPNVLFGGGGNGLTIESTQAVGYQVADDIASFTSLSTNADLISAQFGATHLPYEYDYLKLAYPYPHLKDMVVKSLDALDDDPDGFILMIEGGRIDHACHDNELEKAVHETLAFSDAVQAALDWAAGREDTLILVTADHETGGLTVTQDNGSGTYPTATWSSTGHTSQEVPVYAWGENAELVSGTMDNTDMVDICTADTSPGTKASNPDPRHEALDVLLDTVLTWTAGDSAVLHNVYLGNDPDELAEVSQGQSETRYDPAGLDADTICYWRVDEVDGSQNVIIGDTWRFTTLGPPTPVTNPYPGDGATDVFANAILAWTPGARAESHDVYFGTDSEPPFQVNQTGTSFNPGPLLPGTIYYWRIDEINSAGNNQGSVFSFVTAADPPPQTAWADGENTIKGTIIDGDYNFTHGSDDNYEVLQEIVNVPNKNGYSTLDHTWTFMVEGGSSVKFFVEAWQTTSSDGDDFVFSYSRDGYNFTDMLTITKTADTDTPQLFVFPDTLSNGILYIKVQDSNHQKKTLALDTLSVDEIYVITSDGSMPYYPASVPTPPDGAEGVELNPVLAWVPGDNAVTHNVYFSTDKEYLTPVSENQTETTYTPPLDLNELTTYYWRIDEVRDGGLVTQGPVWMFNTTYIGECIPSPSYFEVDAIVTTTLKGSGGKSYGVATVTVVDNCGNPASGVRVIGTFTGDFDETVSGTTGTDGVVVVQTLTQVKKPKFGFIVDSLH